ncbi:hypothetical protein SDC9_100851 [bioreactor metagenome]|uniref:Uncharacterized protein n=1 Tax=bioreactor metagenome TaxID=1076179 RepID=A0A645AMV6_9ZZZZ
MIQGVENKLRVVDAHAVAVIHASAHINDVFPLPLRRFGIYIRIAEIAPVARHIVLHPPGSAHLAQLRGDGMPVHEINPREHPVEGLGREDIRKGLVVNNHHGRGAFRAVHAAVSVNVLNRCPGADARLEGKAPLRRSVPVLRVAGGFAENTKSKTASAQRNRRVHQRPAQLQLKPQPLLGGKLIAGAAIAHNL